MVFEPLQSYALNLKGLVVKNIRVDYFLQALKLGTFDNVKTFQFDNDVNPRTHYLTTAEEILSALEGKVDLVAMGAGSGGTLSGVSHKFKERNSKCIVVGADPKGSRMLNKKAVFHPFLVSIVSRRIS